MCVTPSDTCLIAKSISSSVVKRPRLNLIDECAKSSPYPNAINTYDGSSDAEVQADPEDTPMF